VENKDKWLILCGDLVLQNAGGEEEPLPPRWSMQVAPNGRTFFIDHASRRTTWIDPRNGRASPMPNQTRRVEDDLGPLPEGWEERVHTDGRVFYIDHSGLYYIMFLALTINLTKPPLQTREPRSGRILACPIQTLPDRLCPTPEITSRNTSISRVILESL